MLMFRTSMLSFQSLVRMNCSIFSSLWMWGGRVRSPRTICRQYCAPSRQEMGMLRMIRFEVLQT